MDNPKELPQIGINDILDFYFDVNTKSFINIANGQPLLPEAYFSIIYKQKLKVRWNIGQWDTNETDMSKRWKPVDLSAVTSWTSALNDIFNETDYNKCMIFMQGTADFDDTQKNIGKIVCTYDSFTAPFLDKILKAQKGYLNVYIELNGYVIIGGATYIAFAAKPHQQMAVAESKVYMGSDVPPKPISDYYTKAEIDAIINNLPQTSYKIKSSSGDATPGWLEAKIDNSTIKLNTTTQQIYSTGGEGDHKVLASGTDTAAGFLDTKVDGTTIKIANEKLTVVGGGGSDHKVMASGTDATPGYLDAKVDGTSIKVQGDKLVAVSSGASYTVKATSTDSSPGFLDTKVDGTSIKVVGDKLVSTASGATYQVKGDASDVTPGFLSDKVDGTSIKVNANHKLEVIGGGSSDHKVLADASDPSAGYLDSKVDGTTVKIENHQIVFVDSYKVKASATDTIPAFLDIKVDGTTIKVENDKLIATTQPGDHKVSMDGSATPDYLQNLVDGSTIKNNGGKLSATGDIKGPASSTDGAVALFDGITGKLLKDSAALIGNAKGNVATYADDKTLVASILAEIIAGTGLTILGNNLYLGDGGTSPVIHAGPNVTPKPFATCTNGEYSQYNDNGQIYELFTFKKGGENFSLTVGVTGGNVDVLIVAAGGAGNIGYNVNAPAGGGGGGGVKVQTMTLQSNTTYTGYVAKTTVQKSHSAVNYNNPPEGNGDKSIFNGVTALGGGTGASYYAPGSGGSGGGGQTTAGGTGTAGQGYNGGTGYNASSNYTPGGGGGAGEAGHNATANVKSGDGGNGFLCNITGTNVYYGGGGGGGGGTNCTAGVGGLGGGGVGGTKTVKGQAGTNGLGGGGGGGGGDNVSGETRILGGDGGSGIVIVRHAAVNLGKYPKLRFFRDTSAWQYSNDGINYFEMTQGLTSNRIVDFYSTDTQADINSKIAAIPLFLNNANITFRFNGTITDKIFNIGGYYGKGVVILTGSTANKTDSVVTATSITTSTLVKISFVTTMVEVRNMTINNPYAITGSANAPLVFSDCANADLNSVDVFGGLGGNAMIIVRNTSLRIGYNSTDYTNNCTIQCKDVGTLDPSNRSVVVAGSSCQLLLGGLANIDNSTGQVYGHTALTAGSIQFNYNATHDAYIVHHTCGSFVSKSTGLS